MNNSKETYINSKAEVRRLMGTAETISLPHLKKALLPEEVSAEILKALRGDVQRRRPEIALDAAVITVPTYFSTIQSEATKRAGEFGWIQPDSASSRAYCCSDRLWISQSEK